MAVYGYARASTLEQNVTIEEDALRRAGCEVVRSEKVSGSSRAGRSELALLLQFLRHGDTLIVTRVDRLAHSIKDFQDMVHELRAAGVTLRATEQPIDTSSAAGKAFLDMLGVFAEFETNLRRERQMEGIAQAKAKGSTRSLGRRTIPISRNCSTSINESAVFCRTSPVALVLVPCRAGNRCLRHCSICKRWKTAKRMA